MAITEFPINTKVFSQLDEITDDQATDSDGVMFFDESSGVMKRITRGELFKNKVIPINSVADFPALETDAYSDRQQFHLNSFAPNGATGGGPLLWDPDLPKSLHDGIRYFSPTVPIPADFDNPSDVQDYLDGVGEEWPAGDGVFVLTLFSIQSSESPTINNALVQFDGPSGNTVKNGPVPSSIGTALIESPNITEVSYHRLNADNTVTARTTAQHKTDLQINNVDNTSDLDKPISTAAQSALDLKADTETVGLALALKAPLSSPAFTGNPTAPTPPANDNDMSIANTAYVQTELLDRPQTIENVAALSTFTPVVGGIYILADSGWRFVARSGTLTPNNKNTFASATSGVYFQRVDYISENRDEDLSRLCGDARSVVITGDSLAAGLYDWPIGTTPLDYTFNNPPGVMGWGQMLRDFIHRSDINFVGADNCAMTKTGTAVVSVNNLSTTDWYFYPFNCRAVKLRGYASTDVVRVMVPRESVTDVMRIYCVNTGASDAGMSGKVDVRVAPYPYTTFVDRGTITTGGRTEYVGLAPYYHDIGENWPGSSPLMLEFYNFRQVNDSEPTVAGVQLSISGFGEKRTAVNLTSRGGYTSAQLLAEVDTLITDYSPDVTFIQIGANDRALGYNSATVIENITNIVLAIRAANLTAKIVLLSTARATDVGFAPTDVVNGETMELWLEAIEIAARDLECYYVDVYNMFKNVNSNLWRFDNIHLKKFGNKVLFDNIVNRFFAASASGSKLELADPEPHRQYRTGSTYNEKRGVIAGCAEYMFNESALIYALQNFVGASGVIKSVTRTSAASLRIDTNYPIRYLPPNNGGESFPCVDIRVEYQGTSGTFIPMLVPFARGENWVEYSILNLLATPPSTAAVTDIVNDGTRYIVSWS